MVSHRKALMQTGCLRLRPNERLRRWFILKGMVDIKTGFRLSLCCLLLILGACFHFLPANAASSTILAVSPPETDVPLSNQVTVTLNVSGGVNVNAFEVTLQYDPAVLSLASHTHGDYLSNLWEVEKVNNPGYFKLAASQLSRPGANGDGTLLELVFDTLAEGTTEIKLGSAMFSDNLGNKTYPTREQGKVNVLNMPVHTPTRTATQLTKPDPTATATIISPATSTPRATSTASVPQPVTETAMTEPQVGYPVSETITADPAEIAATQTSTETSANNLAEGNPTETATGADNQPNASENNGQPQANQNDEQAWLETALWAVLLLGSAAIITMIIKAIRRKNNKSEDYLL